MSKQKQQIKLEHNWRYKTIERLENDVWPEVADDTASSLVKMCHVLRKKVLNDFAVEDLRIMIGQDIALDYLIPLAIEVLCDDLFVEGDYYEGDLLNAVLRIKPCFWSTHHQYWVEIYSLIQDREAELSENKIEFANFYTAGSS